MLVKTIVLGSAGSAPTKTRRMPSVVIVYGGDMLMFDCGEGTQFQMLQYDLNPVRIKAIFLSHAHGDHTIGIAGLVRTMALNSRVAPLLIFVPAGYERIIKSLIAFDKAIITYPIIIKGIKSGVVYQAKDYSVSAFRVNHTIPTYGYVFKERSRMRFNRDLAHRLGLRDWMFTAIQKKGALNVGRERIRLSQVAKKQEGKKVVYVTDTRPTRSAQEAARNADLLIHESSYKDSETRLAKKRKHAAAGEVAMLARKAHAKRLVLTHISARYRTDAELLKDARRVFRDAVVARDGYTLVI